MIKRILILVLALLLAAVPALAETAGASPSARTLTVSGSAEIAMKANYATLTIGAVTKEATVQEAQAKNAALIDAILVAIRAQGVADTEIETSSFSLNVIYDYQYGKLENTQVLSGYQVENMLTVTVRDLDMLSNVLDASMDAGANQSYGISFYSDNAQAASDQAMQGAIAEAQRKAGLMASAAGVTLGELINVSEGTQGGYVNLYSARAEVATAKAGDSTTLLSGDLTVSATVTLTYAIQ